jgi:hypothetical protein
MFSPVADWEAAHCISKDKDTEIRVQKPNPITTDTSKARMSTISPPLGLAGATPLSVIKGVELALRSEGAVDSTTGGMDQVPLRCGLWT